MILERIEILNFKNIAETAVQLSPGVNCLLGMNGMGKSNFLEAIYFLSFARPMRSMPETALIRHGEDMLLVKGEYLMDSGSRENISCGIVKGKGKSLRLNGKEYKKISGHIGRFPIVTVSPQDSSIVSGAGEERRRLADMVISQADKAYLSYLISYGRALESRNRMLRAGVRDQLLFESIERTMEEAACEINKSRAMWTKEISPVFEKYYNAVSGDDEHASISYRSVLNGGKRLSEVFRESHGKDIALGYTSQGVHRDDIEMCLGSYSMRRLGSQGQLKTFTIALRFAIFDYLKQRGNVTPLLLLDDIFDKLDAIRVERIMEIVSRYDTFGQIFITDTNRKHLDEILAHIGGERQLIEVGDGNFNPINII